MSNAGRPTDLTNELIRKIGNSILDGNNIKETAKICEIPESTLYDWTSRNYLNISDKISIWKHERMLNLAENNLRDILEIGVTDKESLKVVQDTSKYVTETLGKDIYSKRTETDITSKGERIKGFNFISNDPDNKTDNQAGESVEETPGQND